MSLWSEKCVTWGGRWRLPLALAYTSGSIMNQLPAEYDSKIEMGEKMKIRGVEGNCHDCDSFSEMLFLIPLKPSSWKRICLWCENKTNKRFFFTFNADIFNS